MFKKSLAFVAGLAFILTAWAASTHLKPGHPDRYVVQKGDTLWDISAKFLTQPWYWPEIWQANPQIHNPHLIYPGDVLNLGYDHQGKAVLKLSPSVHEGKTPIAAIPLDQLKMFLQDLRVVDPDALEDAPYVVALQNNRLRGTPGQFAYVRQLDQATPGQRFAVVRPTHMFDQYGGSGEDSDIVGHGVESNVEIVPGPWAVDSRGDGRLGRGDALAMEVRVIGTVQVLRTGDPATTLISDSKMEIRKGDRLLPVDDTPYDAYYYPHAAKAKPGENARVIALADAINSVGRHQVVALSVGSADGVDNGSTFAVFHPGEAINDDVDSYVLSNSQDDDVQLPDEYVGHLMVFRTFNHVSYALVMDDLRPVQIGDKLRLP